VPALVLAGLDPVAAVATNKLAGVFGTGSATLAFARAGKIEANMAPAALAAGIGAALGALALPYAPRALLSLALPVRPHCRRTVFRALLQASAKASAASACRR